MDTYGFNREELAAFLSAAHAWPKRDVLRILHQQPPEQSRVPDGTENDEAHFERIVKHISRVMTDDPEVNDMV